MLETLYGHEVLSYQSVYRQGCYELARFWLRGHVRVPGFPSYIYGLTGPETVIQISRIFPIGVFQI